VKIPIFDLMDDCSPVGIEICEPDAGLAERICGQVDQKRKKPGRKLGLSLLIAAVVALLAVGTVAAVGFGMYFNRLEKPIEDGVFLALGEASIGAENEIRFAVEGDPKEVSFDAAWLPSEPSKTVYNRNGECVLVMRENGPAYAGYQVAIYDGSVLRDYTFLLHGTAEVLAEDEWNGWQRMQIKATTPDGVTNNCILLHSVEHQYLLNIAGTRPMETLQRIAENLTVHVSDLPAEHMDGIDPNYIYLTSGIDEWNKLEYRENYILEAELDDVPADCGMHLEETDSTPMILKKVAVYSDGMISSLDETACTEWNMMPTAALSFHISGEMYPAEFRANWLPEDTVSIRTGTEDGWSTGLQDESDELLYHITVTNGDRLYNGVATVIGRDYELIGVDEWNGMQRIRFSFSDMRPESARYILLFSQDGNYLIKISGYADWETLEKIAENLEIRTLDEPLQPELPADIIKYAGIICTARG